MFSCYVDESVTPDIPGNTRLAEAPSYGEPITKYDDRCAGAEDYRALAKEAIGQERSH